MKSLIFIHSLFFTFSIGSIFSGENQENEVDSNRSAVIYNSSFEEGDGEDALGWAFTHSPVSYTHLTLPTNREV